jgi:pimeloyl-ACP methyl ester carboxylesterase
VTIIDRGSGVAVVLVPGIQGRWEWMTPAVDALARRCRVITFSLADEPTSGVAGGAERDFSGYVQQVADALDAAGLERAAICGVSYGGLIAAVFAARMPTRTSALVLVSAIPPSWTPDARAAVLLRAPRLLSPLFCLNSLRLLPEMVAAKGGLLAGLTFALTHVITILGNRFSPRLMARRARLAMGLDLERELRRVQRPTLVVTGDEHLDRVVPARLTRDYLRIWPHASTATLARTGHLGLVTRPQAFASLVVPFAEEALIDRDRRRIG